ncbi:hypothetical protein NW760_005590 [Fusarium oxysporum]|nr:hypothetical protein NW769_011558 [Fusarium oxysporum]KAJ4232473.1 hypothetical protein NW760_005590 [Fusarium oxysporum]
MRGLAQAAMVLAPTLVLAHGPHHPPPPPPPPPPPMGFLPSALDVTPSAFVTVKLPLSESESYPLTLRFDVEESEEVCGPASITLNGEPLKQDAKGRGVGSFLVNNETTISADWDFECIGPKEFPFGQSMRFNVKALDDMALTQESSFWMTFKQTAPVRISDVGNAAYVWSLSMPFSKDKESSSDDKSASTSPPIWEYPDRDFQDPEEELQVELMELNALHKQILQLEELVKEREASVAKKLGKQYPPPPPSTMKKIKQCDGVQCVLHTVGEEVRHSAHRFYDSIFGHPPPPHGPHGPHHGPHYGNGTHRGPHPPHHGPPHPPPPPHHGHPPFPFPGGHPPPPICAPCACDPHHGNPPPPPHHGDKPHHDRPEHGHGGFGAEDHEGHPPPPPPHHPIIIILGIVTIALALFCAIAIAYIHRRVARLSPEARRAIRRAFRQTRDERRKNSALKAAYRAFVTRWIENEDDEKEAMLSGERRRRSSSCSSVTMEEEIASFREAAHMVEGIVAAEEGHHSHARSYSYAAGPPVPPRPSHHTAATAYPGFMETDENLPAYDDDERDSSVVADGCRYTPGSSDYTPSNSGSNASDVLGDTKN